MRVPILRLPFTSDDITAVQQGIADVLAGGTLTLGRWTREFEERFAAFTGARYAVATNSGTSALELIIRALGIEGRSVIIPTNTFSATAVSVMHAGNRVIFADANPETFCLDPEDVERRIDPETAAVVLVHVGGIITPKVGILQDLCVRRGLYLIEDCAHAHGCTINGRGAGTLGIAGAFSFFPTKLLTTGEGGMVTTNDQGLYERMLVLRNQGKDPAYGNRIGAFGHNWRLSEVAAVIGVQQMRRASEIVATRQAVARFYDAALPRVAGVRPLRLAPDVVSSYYKYAAYLDERFKREEVKRVLRDVHGVSLTGEVYADLCHREPLWTRVTFCGARRVEPRPACHRWPACGCDQMPDEFPGAEYVSRHHICLPVYPDLSEAELNHVVESLDQTLRTLGG